MSYAYNIRGFELYSTKYFNTKLLFTTELKVLLSRILDPQNYILYYN